jgi:hypothetical protein
MTHPRGRQPISVDQPPSGGTDFPLVAPSADVQFLLGDFYLAYDDDRCEFTLPFRILRLYGFGSLAPASGPWTPTHDYDVVVVDAEDNVVFDSSAADHFNESDWPLSSPRLKVLEWIGDTAVCRLTFHTQWSDGDVAAGLDQDYSLYLEPESAELDGRTLLRVPPRVRSIRVGPTTIAGSKLVLDSGFNAAWREVDLNEELSAFRLSLDDLGIDADSPIRTLRPGTRSSRRIMLSAVPGDGLGTVPGCEDVEPVLKKLGKATPDESGNLLLDGEGCLKVQRPVGLVSHTPRQFRYLSNVLSAEQSAAAIEIGNDCGPCCPCDYFVRTYKGIASQWERWKSLAQDTGEIRDQHRENIARWVAEKSCRESNPLRVVLLSEYNCKAAVGGLYCNTNKCCAAPLVLRFTFQYYRGGSPLSLDGFTCNQAEIDGSPQRRAGRAHLQGESYALAGQWPVYEAILDYADPQDSSRVSFRACLPDCVEGDSVQVWVSAHFPDMNPSPTGACSPGTVSPPGEVAAIWAASALGAPAYPTRAIKASDMIPVNPAQALDSQCYCPSSTDGNSET